MSQELELLAARKEELDKREQSVEKQLDRIYKMIEEGKPTAFLKVEFKRAVEKISEKYQVILSLLDLQKSGTNEEDFEKQTQAIQEQYKEDVVVLAAAIDEAMGITPEEIE